MENRSTTKYLSESPLEAVLQKLEFSEAGLAEEEVTRRREIYGPNELSDHSQSAWIKFLHFFWGPIPWMIEIAAGLSLAVGHYVDFSIIIILLCTNAVVGFWEESQAGHTIEALKAQLALEAYVKRSGVWKKLPASDIVPGDYVRLTIGKIVPADVRIMTAEATSIDQSALTGESLPVGKEVGDIAYSGSVVKSGELDAVVFATGENTYFGKTAALVEKTEKASHFQKAILHIGNYLIILAVTLVSVIVAVGFFRGDEWLTTVEFALILMVAAIPVAMPTVLSVTMAVGAKLLATKGAVVTHLASIEELAGVDVLCTDKTGTLTKNSLTLGESFLLESKDEAELVTMAALASKVDNNDVIDETILNHAKTISRAAFTVQHFEPFDPIKKRTSAMVEIDGHTFQVSKGAPQVIMDLVALPATIVADVQAAIDTYAARGYRTLAVACTGETGAWKFLGLLSLYDPPREDSAATIAAARSMGITIKMLTGDQVAIAREISATLGLGKNIIEGVSLFAEERAESSLAKIIEDADGFAQVFPDHKYQIVKALQSTDHIVGMTGDGVNDAPALKVANVGVAVSGATDAARSAADVVLLSTGLSVIIEAIKESRKIFQRMNSYAIYRITETFRVLLFMTFSILIFNFYPVTAVMVVFLALLNDGAILSIAYDKVRDSLLPERWNLREVLSIATVMGIIGVIESFSLFYFSTTHTALTSDMVQTLMYLKLSIAGHLTIFATRTRGSFWSFGPSKILFSAVVGTQLIATAIALLGIFMTPLSLGWVLVVWTYALVCFVVNDGVKVLTYRVLGRTFKKVQA